jgi:tetratricopeptide (TPR) repeat protein
MSTLAAAYQEVGRFADAIALRSYLLEQSQAHLGPDHSDTLGYTAGLAGAYQAAGQWDTSIPLWEHLLEKDKAILGPTHPSTIDVMHALAMNYSQMGRFGESTALHETVLKLLTSTTGPEGRLWCMMTFAIACQGDGKLDQAERLLRAALEIEQKQSKSLYNRVKRRANTLGWLARTLLLKKQYAAAEPLAREAVAIWVKEKPDDQRRFYWVSLLGEILFGRQKYAEAEPLLLQGYEGMKAQEATLFANEKRRLVEACHRIVRFYEATQQLQKAQDWRRRLEADSRAAEKPMVAPARPDRESSP